MAEMTEADVVIKARGLTKRFGHTLAVDRLDLEVRRGEIYGLIGPDGAGKTTTIRLLAAVTPPTAGSAYVGGLDTVRQAEALRHHVGYVAQRFILYGDLSVLENLEFYADIYGVRGAERRQRIDQLLTFTRLAEFTGRRAHHLSGGMQRKLALACALIHRPQVLFMDEPTTGIDPVSRREFWDLLAHLHSERITLFVSTPYMDEAERCSRVGLMFNGHLMEQGSPADIRRLVPGEVLSLIVDDLPGARLALEGIACVQDVQAYGDRLRILGDDAVARQGEIMRHLEAHGIAVQRLHIGRIRMGEAFAFLIRRWHASQEGQSHGG